MADYRPSIVSYHSQQSRSRCGYCKTSEGSQIYGLTAFTLRPEDYQSMIDRGWRRCGKFCYKPIMDSTCCPSYTIRCATKDFRLSKTQKKILKRFNNFLANGVITKDKFYRATEINQPMEMYGLDVKGDSPDRGDAIASVLPVKEPVITKMENVEKAQPEVDSNKPAEGLPVTSQTKEKTSKNKCMKAKYLRIERKRQKLQKLGLSEEEISKKLVEKKKYPIIKTIEDYINENSSRNNVHNLKIYLVKSSPRSKEFTQTFSVVFDLYKRYQRAIHKDPPERLTKSQFENFLVNSPLQVFDWKRLPTWRTQNKPNFPPTKIKLVLTNSDEFKLSFKESSSLYAKYQKCIHHEPDEECDINAYHDFLVDSPIKASKQYGSYHQQYWLDNKLIAVGVIDILPKCVSSVYFFYDPDYAYLSLGTYGALREVEFTRKLSVRFPELSYYYMGYYIHSCVKMKYKGAFKPSYLLCPEAYTWHPIQECLKKLQISKYSRLNEDKNQKDEDSNLSTSDVLILFGQTVMTLTNYMEKSKCDSEELDLIKEYAFLIGKKCAKNMLLYRD